MKNFFNVLFVIAVALWLYSCATMLDIEKLHWNSSSNQQSTEFVENGQED